MTGCTIFEIQGSDPSRIAGAVRCDRSAVGMTILAEAEFPRCEHHGNSEWTFFTEDRSCYGMRRSGPAVWDGSQANRGRSSGVKRWTPSCARGSRQRRW